jgi:hypothetical protein
MDKVEDEDMTEVEEDHPLVLMMERWATFRDFVENCVLFVGTTAIQSIQPKISSTF